MTERPSERVPSHTVVLHQTILFPGSLLRLVVRSASVTA